MSQDLYQVELEGYTDWRVLYNESLNDKLEK